jgi:hypothetical protein
VLGTAAMTPLAAGAHRGRPWAELFVTVGFGSVAVAMLLASALLLWGLRRPSVTGATRESVIHGGP